MYEVKIICNHPHAAEFVRILMSVRERKYVIVEKFTKPGIIFYGQEDLVDLRDLVFGCVSVNLNDILIDDIVEANEILVRATKKIDNNQIGNDGFQNICREAKNVLYHLDNLFTSAFAHNYDAVHNYPKNKVLSDIYTTVEETEEFMRTIIQNITDGTMLSSSLRHVSFAYLANNRDKIKYSQKLDEYINTLVGLAK
jgi:hypothetical protein